MNGCNTEEELKLARPDGSCPKHEGRAVLK
jgi:hypothetical protein